MSTLESTPAVVDVERRQAPPRSGIVVVSVFGLLVIGLLIKSFPWLTPVWLGPVVLAAVAADISSLGFLRQVQARLGSITVFRIKLPSGTAYITDDSSIKPLIGARALLVPVFAGAVVATITTAFFIHNYGLPLSLYRLQPWSIAVQCVPLSAAVAGIYGAILLSRKVLSWRLSQAALRSAGVPQAHFLASTTFVISTLLSIYILWSFGNTAYEALKPVPPVKTIGDLLFSSFSPKGTYLIEHRESLKPDTQERWELYFVDQSNTSNRTLLLSYNRAAKVTFSPDESSLIVSEKTRGYVRPLFLIPVTSLRGAAMGFARLTRNSTFTIDDRLRQSYATPQRQLPEGNMQVGDWSVDGEIILFSFVNPLNERDKAPPNIFFVWDYKKDTFTTVERGEQNGHAVLKSFLAERERKVKESLKAVVESSVIARMEAENRGDLTAIAGFYAPEVGYRGKGLLTREAIRTERIEEFPRWPDKREVILGEIEVAQKDGKWCANWKTSADLHSGDRPEMMKQARMYECQFVSTKAGLFIATEKLTILNSETLPDPRTPREMAPVTETPADRPIVNASPASAPKRSIFPEGAWVIRSQTRDSQETIAFNNILTVNGTSFRYDINQVHDLIDPAHNPWTKQNVLRGLTRYSYTYRYTGKVIHSDSNAFTVKILSQSIVNKKPSGLGVGFVSNPVGGEWTFLKRGEHVIDKADPTTEFHKMSSAGPGNTEPSAQ